MKSAIKYITSPFAALAAFTPLAAFAQPNLEYFEQGGTKVVEILRIVMQILMGLIVIYFIWSLIKFFGKEEDREAAKKNLGMSLLILVVAFSFYGVILLVQGFAGIDTTGQGQLVPTI